MSHRPALAILFFAACVAAPVSSAPPVPPNIPYQGVLLDDQGQPRSGTVDLTFRIYDSILGGNLVYKEEILGVALVDGVFTVELGPSGNPTDTPVDPLTTDIVTALAGDLAGTGSSRFIAVQVGSATPGSRNPILSVPYALRSVNADVAATALVAQDSQSLGGFEPVVLNAIVDNWNEDGGPPGSDPREGVADTDGDGTPNFADSDNDDDGISDQSEISNGSDINLVTPTVTAIDPAQLLSTGPEPITVSGTNFDPAMSAELGGIAIPLSNITATSFDSTSPQLPGGATSVTVTLPNGESDTLDGIVVDLPLPIATGLTHSNGTLPVNLVFRSDDRAVAFASPRFAFDAVDDGIFDFPGTTRLIAGNGRRTGTVDPNDRIAVLTCITTSCNVEIQFDDDDDGFPGEFGEQRIAIETIGGSATSIRSSALGFDGLGRVAAAYIRENNLGRSAVIAHDLDDDEAFAPSEVVTVQSVTGVTNNYGDLAFDASNRANYLFLDTGADEIRLAADLNGDGDVADPDELKTVYALSGTSDPSCLGLATDSAGNLAFVLAQSPVALVRLFWDGNGDRDFDDAGESFTFPSFSTSPGCDIAAHPSGGVVVAIDGDDAEVYSDRNGDRDFDDLNERVLVGRTSSPGPIAVGLDSEGRAHVTTTIGAFRDTSANP